VKKNQPREDLIKLKRYNDGQPHRSCFHKRPAWRKHLTFTIHVFTHSVQEIHALRTALHLHPFVRKGLKDVNVHSAQSHLSSCLLSKNSKIKIYKNIIYLLFCTGVKLGPSHYGSTDWGVFKNKVLRRTFGPKKEEEAEGWRRLRECL
jgi:hypothetical protein